MKTKKRKLNRMRMTLVVIVCVLALALSGLGIYGIWNWQDQKGKRETVESLIAQKEAYETVMETQLPADMDPAQFEELKNLAAGKTDWSSLEGYDPEEKVEQDWYDNAVENAKFKGDKEAYDLLKNAQKIPAQLLAFYLKDHDRYAFVKAYLKEDQLQTAPDTLTESLATVPHLLQWDTRWGYVPYADSLIWVAGCAPTCLSMVMSYLKQDPAITPAAVAKWSADNGHFVSGVGTAHSLLTAAADNWGVQSYGVPVDRDSIQNALNAGQLLILNVVPGHFTEVGHFIVATGMEDGKIKILDPNSNERTRLWDLDTVLGETAAAWAYSA